MLFDHREGGASVNKKEGFAYRTLFKRYYVRLFIVLAGTVIVSAGSVFLRWAIGDALDTGKLGAGLLAAAGVLLAVSQTVFYIRQILFMKIQKSIYQKLQRKVLHGSMEALGKNDLGTITAYYISDVSQIDGFLNRILGKAFPDLVGWMITAGLMFWFDLFLGIAAVVVTVGPVLFLHRMSRPIARGTEEYQAALETANQSVVTGLHNIETIKASCKEDAFLQDNEEKLAHLQKKKRRVAIWEALLGVPMLASSFLTIIFLTILSGWLVLLGRITAGQLLTVVTLTDNIVSFVMSLEGTIGAFRRALVSMGRLDAFLGQEEEREGVREAGEIREIVFDRIHFAYPGSGGREIYHGFSERWRQGLYFIKGGNGEGKSTLIKLLTGIYVVSSGEITINGIPVQEYRLASLREKIVVVPQENILFQGSIRSNLTCGKDMACERVEEACRKTGIHEEILRMPAGYETALTENGGVLSGGQKQRLCLARVLLRDGDVYIFDEPTSALDKANRDHFAGLLTELAKEKIVVVITHEKELLDTAEQVAEIGTGSKFRTVQ